MFLQWAVIIDQVDAPWDVLRETNAVVAAAYLLRSEPSGSTGRASPTSSPGSRPC